MVQKNENGACNRLYQPSRFCILSWTQTFKQNGTVQLFGIKGQRDNGTSSKSCHGKGRDRIFQRLSRPIPGHPGTQSLSIFSYDFLFWNIFSLFGGKKLHPKPSSSLVILAIQLTTLFLLYCCLLVCAQFGQKEKKMQFIAAVLLRLDVQYVVLLYRSILQKNLHQCIVLAG